MDKAPDAFRIISEVADDLDVPQHVLRFWETRFSQIRPMKRSGGRRYYRPDDVDLLRGIRHLLYGEGYTIRGVQRILREQGVRAVQGVARGEPLAAPPPGQTGDEGEDHPVAVEPTPAAAPARRSEPSMGLSMPPAMASAGVSFDPDNMRRLETTLDELLECRRILDTVATRPPGA